MNHPFHRPLKLDAPSQLILPVIPGSGRVPFCVSEANALDLSAICRNSEPEGYGSPIKPGMSALYNLNGMRL
jgi:hypothetical protein